MSSLAVPQTGVGGWDHWDETVEEVLAPGRELARLLMFLLKLAALGANILPLPTNLRLNVPS